MAPLRPSGGRGRGLSRSDGRVRWATPQTGSSALSAYPLPPAGAGLSGEIFPASVTCVRLAANDLRSSCAGLTRASTSLFRPIQGVGGRVKPGQDENWCGDSSPFGAATVSPDSPAAGG